MPRPRRRHASSATSRSSSARSTASGWSTSTPRRRRRSRVAVLDAMDDCYRRYYANIHRGVYSIAEESTAAFEDARRKVARFINAPRPEEIVFTRNATEAINLVAYTWARANLQRRRRDRALAHGAPRQRRAVAHARGRTRRRAALDPAHRRLPARPHRTSTSCSTAPSCSRSARCRTCSARSTRSGRSPTPRTRTARSCSSTRASSCRTSPTDVQAWDADFVAFSAHKLLGPSGIGALWARRELLEAMPPFLGGGEMIRDVRLDGFTTERRAVEVRSGHAGDRRGGRFRRGGRLLSALGMDAVRDARDATHRATRSTRSRDASPTRSRSTARATSRSAAARSRSCSTGSTPTTSARCSTRTRVCVRAGHHCAKPLMRQLGVPATSRASFYVYNDEADVDVLVEALAKAQKFFAL